MVTGASKSPMGAREGRDGDEALRGGEDVGGEAVCSRRYAENVSFAWGVSN